MAEYIDREKLDFLNDFRIDGGKYAGLRLDDVFDELATTDVAPVVHAKWINAEYETCSVCGYVIDGDHEFDFNYCPCCGAKMDKE